MDSMTQLAALLEDHDMVDERELGELYREMGQLPLVGMYVP